MQPLTTQEEVSLASDDQNDRVEQDEEEGKDMKRDDGFLSTTGIENDYSSSTENNEATNENRQSDSNVENTFDSGDVIQNASIQEDLQNESPIDDISVASHRSLGTPVSPESEIGYGSFVAPNFESSDGSLVAEKSESILN